MSRSMQRRAPRAPTPGSSRVAVVLERLAHEVADRVLVVDHQDVGLAHDVPPVVLERQLDRERRARGPARCAPSGAAVALDDVVADVETEPGAAGLGGEERLEDRSSGARR